MTMFSIIAFAVVLLICLRQRQTLRRQAHRIAQLESACRGARSGLTIPYESLALLSTLRDKARQWEGHEDDPEVLTVRPALIERIDDYLSGVISTLPEGAAPEITSRPDYAALYETHSVMLWPDREHPISFPCTSRMQAGRIAVSLAAKGVEARQTARQSFPSGN